MKDIVLAYKVKLEGIEVVPLAIYFLSCPLASDSSAGRSIRPIWDI